MRIKLVSLAAQISACLDEIDRMPEASEMRSQLQSLRSEAPDFVSRDAFINKFQALITPDTSSRRQKHARALLDKFSEFFLANLPDAKSWISSVLNNNTSAVKKGLKKSNTTALYRDHINVGTTWSALHAAAFQGHLESAKLLVDHGLDIEATDSVYLGTPLLWAAYGGQYEMCKYLLECGAQLQVANVEGKTPLDLVPPSVGYGSASEWKELLSSSRRSSGKRARQSASISGQESLEGNFKDTPASPPAKRSRPSRRSAAAAATAIKTSPEELLGSGEEEENVDVEGKTPTTAVTSEGGNNHAESMLKSVGIISNDTLVKQVLDNKTFTHHAMHVGLNVKNLNIRVLLNVAASNSASSSKERPPQVVVNHNNKTVPMGNNPV
ncbi:MAG: hypothetical protein SGCHY_001696 [Lobulomycetales sp.]